MNNNVYLKVAFLHFSEEKYLILLHSDQAYDCLLRVSYKLESIYVSAYNT